MSLKTEREYSLPDYENEDKRPTLLAVAHTYQPPREFLNLATGERTDIVAEVNEKIHRECYRQLFVQPPFQDVEPVPPGTIFSLFGTLREWGKVHHPEEFQKLQKNIGKIGDKEYRILGDPYLHPILPLLPEEDQDMLIKIGKHAFQEDLGFTPKGFWLPETGVASPTLRILAENGYEFVTLRDYQLESHTQNPMYVPIFEQGEQAGEVAVIHADSELSGIVSFHPDQTVNAESFITNNAHRGNLAWMSDAEFYGHHERWKDHFLYTVTKGSVLEQAGYRPFDVQQALTQGSKAPTTIYEGSSWSCPHNLGRWTGDSGCSCDNPNAATMQEKKYMRTRLAGIGQEINSTLDAHHPGWREDFIEFFLATRKSMYGEGDIAEDMSDLIVSGMDRLRDPLVQNLFQANLARLTGETSCVWFFGEEDRVERNIARTNIAAAETLLQRSKGLGRSADIFVTV